MLTLTSIGECMIEMQPQEGASYTCHYGGDTFNTAQYAAWITPRDEFSIRYFTAVGEDRLSQNLIDSWRADEIDTSLVLQHPSRNSGLYFAHTDENGDRDYVFYRTDSAASKMFKLKLVEQHIETALNSDLIYASAISLMILSDQDRGKLVEMFADAQSRSVKTAFDTNYRSTGWRSADEAAKWIDAISPHVDIMLATNDENSEIFSDSTPEETCERYASSGIPEVVVKCGENGCLIQINDERITVEPGEKITPLDTTSAGDSFNAAYLTGRMQGFSPELSAKNGHLLAGEVIKHQGAIIPRKFVSTVLSNFASKV